ncbi:uncharacterized protein LOC103836353 [Brassica rapa]|uniref:uncharacterized protein LOC103836353 n=1 Tax=Brassica campestris TaxID=3711 RepID=UPI0004F17742|nr:uncharacterized protein LOC103836353 [Brassica rapa]
MAEKLYKAIKAMSIEDDEVPLTLPDEPRFRVFDENEISILGRLLNPECQSMSRMIEYMPTAWRVYGRVRGIALSRDRFQFVFEREEDLQTVLNDRPWSYNHWVMALEKWTANPPEDFLKTMDIWIRIRHIPVNFFTTDTMFRLASEVGTVDTIAYDPKVSHTKDYIRARVCFNLDNPAKATRKLDLKSGGTVTIEFEYEKIHKRCFHCLRLTHEKIRCPLLRGRNSKDKQIAEPSDHQPNLAVPPPKPMLITEGPPGFPPLFPELSKQDLKMAMLYISHADETERRARIERVRQGIADSAAEASVRLTKITNELDKGKGHVYSYMENTVAVHNQGSSRFNVLSDRQLPSQSDDEADSSATNTSSASASQVFPTGFQLGPSSGGRVSGNINGSKTQRKRPPSWKRKARANSSEGSPLSPSQPSSQAKRKSSPPPTSTENKTARTTDTTVASVLKPLPPQ